MKKIFLAVTVMMIAIGLSAQNKKESIVKKIKASKEITSLIINDDVQVVLTNDNTAEIFIEGSPAAVEAVLLTEKNGELTIGSTAFFTKPVVVAVPADFISRIEINGDSKVISYQMLSLKKLDVIINGYSNLFIKTRGTVIVTSVQDYEFTCKRNALKN